MRRALVDQPQLLHGMLPLAMVREREGIEIILNQDFVTIPKNHTKPQNLNNSVSMQCARMFLYGVTRTCVHPHVLDVAAAHRPQRLGSAVPAAHPPSIQPCFVARA